MKPPKIQASATVKILCERYKLTPRDLENLNIKIYQAKPVRKAWKLYTSLGVLSLKKTSIHPDRLTFITEGAAYIHQNNFHKMIEYHPFNNGKFFLPKENSNLILTKWVNGKESDMTEPRQEYQAAVSMAQFHQASRGFNLAEDFKRFSRLGCMEDDFARYQKEISAVQTLLSNRSFPEKLTKLLLEHNNYFLQKAEKAQELLKEFNYPRYIQHAQNASALLHNDFIYHNLIWQHGEIHLIDLDYMTFDLRCIDIAKFLRRNLRQSNWKLRVAENIIKGYTSITPLEQEEYNLIYILLYFPYKYWQTLHFYHTSRRKEYHRRTYNTIKQLVSQKDKKSGFLKRFKEKYL
ncbi:MAG: CotS family spore coat protein [Desulfitobacteriaceae bacterium]|nr:CotS family spore coat protein [Desulfitobacteriaceae bacterium]MDD4752453.1 CotS family spore coat protein [Desulfitobacteriaceae bacterium]